MKIISKIILPTFLISAAFAMISYQLKSDEVTLNTVAFSNLSKNIAEIRTSKNDTIDTGENLINTDKIKTIEKKLKRTIAFNKHQQKLMFKKRHAEIPTIHIAANVEEINNNELIELYAISSEKINHPKLDQPIIDEVKTVDAATIAIKQESGPIGPVEIKSDVTESVVVKEEIDNEMPIYDYSAQSLSKKTDKLYDRELSKTVKNVITREVGANPVKLIKNEIEKEKENRETDENDQIVYDYSTTRQAKNAMKVQLGFAGKTENNEEVETHEIKIIAENINLNDSKFSQVKDFNFTPDYNREERIDSDKDGVAKLVVAITKGVNTQTGIIEAPGMFTTRVELVMNTQNQVSIPLISNEDSEKYYKGGNLILININTDVVDTEIDTRFENKIYFDSKFKKTETRDDANYVLYTGIKNGNVLLKYYLSNNKTAQKVVYVGEREMYFEASEFLNGEREVFSFSTRNLMSSKKSELDIHAEDINVFNTRITAKKRTLNTYELKMPTLIKDARKYIELKHLRDSIFIGTDNEYEIEVPSNEFIEKVLHTNHINSLEDRCLVQINVKKELTGIIVNGKNHHGEMYTETIFLDENGLFSQDNIEMAEKVFIVGDMEGIFSAKLEYSDGSNQYLKTFCSTGTYIVEQL